MSRPLQRRLTIEGRLLANAPVHVGGLAGREDVDLPLARDGQGRVYVPGTSVAGVLRDWMNSHLVDQQRSLVPSLWGPAMVGGTRNQDHGHASHVIVDDAFLEGTDIEVWDHVRIDRRTGAAADRFKFDRAVLPAGTQIPLRLTVELPVRRFDGGLEDDRRVRAGLGCLLNALLQGQVSLGAAVTRGLGSVMLDEAVTIRDEDWSSPEGIAAILRSRVPMLAVADLLAADVDLPLADRISLRQRSAALLTINWRPSGPLMVKSAQAGTGIDAVPFTSAIDRTRVAFTLPGSSIKGAFRSQAERIVRTVLGRRAPLVSHGTSDTNDAQVREPLVSALFGLSRPRAERCDEPAPDPVLPQGARSRIRVATCVARNVSFDAGQWETVLDTPHGSGDSSSLRRRLDDIVAAPPPPGQAAPALEQAFHVAIDRWTGGSAEHLLFSTLEPTNVTWAPLSFTLDVDGLPRGERHAAVTLLLLLVRDFGDNRIPLGYGSTRGFGSVALESAHVRLLGDDWDDTLRAFDGQPITNGLAGLPEQAAMMLDAAWSVWLSEQSGVAGV